MPEVKAVSAPGRTQVVCTLFARRRSDSHLCTGTVLSENAAPKLPAFVNGSSPWARFPELMGLSTGELGACAAGTLTLMYMHLALRAQVVGEALAQEPSWVRCGRTGARGEALRRPVRHTSESSARLERTRNAPFKRPETPWTLHRGAVYPSLPVCCSLH